MKYRLSEIYRGCKKGGSPSLKKDWKVIYYQDGVRKTSRGGINYEKTIKDREKAAVALKDEIDAMLIRHYNREPGKPKDVYILKECLDKSIKEKKGIIAKGSIKEYSTPLKFFYEQTDILGLTNANIRDITKPVMKDILHRMVDARAKYAEKKDKKYSRAYNFRKYKANIGNLFEPWVDDEIIDKNPCDFTSPYKKPAPKVKKILDDEEFQTVKAKILTENPNFYIPLMVLGHTSLRCVEVLRLRIRDINLKKQEIIVYPELVKDREARIVHIPDVLLGKYLLPMQLDTYPDHYFVFGQNFLPEERENHLREDKLNKPWRQMIKNPVDKGGLGIDSNIYYMKDKGMEMKLDDDVPFETVRDQAGHSSDKQSFTYVSKRKAAQRKKELEAENLAKKKEGIEKLKKNTKDF